MAIPQLLLLLLVANGAPIITRLLLGDRPDTRPVDAGRVLRDGRRLFGPSKTVRGIIASIIVSALAAPLLGLSLLTGALVGLFAMLGDLFSSFCKRRLGIETSGMALGLDQIPESLFPALAVREQLGLDAMDIILVVVIFFALELVLSRLLYRLHIRKRPY